MERYKQIGGDLIALYHSEKSHNKSWFYNTKAFAGKLIEIYGSAALEHANSLLEQSSDNMCSFYRNVYGHIQNEFIERGSFENI
ncbi:MAG: hypothetical protein GX638_14010 [Crenarchaeota archaeon]|nr:hypothetical protein [Thermoproteota archaeon]